MPIPIHWPASARQALEKLLAAVDLHLPAPEALVVFGSLVTGGWRPASSNINLAVVLVDANIAELRRLATVFRPARMQAGISPLILERAEIPRVADVFPLKFAHIKAHHHVLRGDDPFGDLAIDLDRLRLRTEAELRNQLIRLRQTIMFTDSDALAAARSLRAAVKPLAVELEAALLVLGHPVPFEADLITVFEAAVQAISGLDAAFFDTLSVVAAGGRLDAPLDLLARLPFQLLRVIEAIAPHGATR